MGRMPKDITGQKFGRLTAIENTGEKVGKASLWLFKCDCGNDKVASKDGVLRGYTRSCGCLVLEKSIINAEIGQKSLHKNFLKEGTSLNKLTDKVQKNNTSGVRGVTYLKRANLWIAQMNFKKKRVLYEYFTNKQDAIKARKEAEEKYFKPMLEKYGKSE